MSGDVHRPSAEPRQTPAADVTFSSQADDRRHGESSSIATSRGSGEKWSERGERLKERFLTPDRRSDEGSGGDSGSERKRLSRVRKSGGGGGGGGFLRDGIFGNGTPKSAEKVSERREGKRRSDNGMLQPEDRRLPGSRRSGESSVRSSPLSQEISINQSATDSAQEQYTNSRPTSMDPAQLVQMALSLSESRKRHASGSLPMPMAAPRSRNVSGSTDKYGTVRTRLSDRPRGSPHLDTYSPVSSNHSREWQGPPSANAIDDNVLYTFSPATLARAEKARKYFELANEHRRLLQHLPPLKPDADANYTFESRSSPGYAQPEIRRVRSNTISKQELGRPYNPLQTLRNRRLRNRERRPFPVPPESFSDTQRVATWMDDVEDASKQPDYRAGEDAIRLPYFSTRPDELDGESNMGKGHRRTGTAGSVITRPENDWTVDPTERLADVYWTEQGDNKSLIENRRCQAIFPSRKRPDADSSRKSAELDQQDRTARNSEPPEEVSDQGEAPRKHRPMLSLHKADRTRLNRLSRLARSTSASSTSSDDDRQSRSNARTGGAVDGLAPLNRHMDAMIAREQNGDVSSPDLTSPDHWDSKNTPFPIRDSKRMSGHRPANSLSVTSDASQQRSKSADGRLAEVPEGERPRFSFDSSPPSSPMMTDFVPSLAMDLSPPSKPRANQSQKNKHRMLPIFRSRSKERSTTEGRDFAFSLDSDRSREPSGNAIDPSRLSVESARPYELQRNKTSDSIISGIHRRGTSRTQTTSDGSIKEPGSTVGRFFKGGRLAELVRADRSRYKNKEGSGSTTDVSVLPSDGSDTDGSVDEPGRAHASPNDSEPSPRTSVDRSRNKQKLHMPNLPTFKSTNARERPKSALLTPVISNEDENNDHISRQAVARREASRSPRIERLLPPRINLPDGNDQGLGVDSPGQTPDTFQSDRSRKGYGFLAPKVGSGTGSAVGSNVSFDNTSNSNKQNGDLPPQGLSRLNPNAGRRHWSISDRGMRNQQRQGLLKNQRVSPRDLARAHALLLASGIKAHSLVTRANTPKEPAPKFLTAASMTASIDTPSIPLKETHLRASAILSSHLDHSFHSLAQARQSYQSSTSQDLHTRLADLKSLAADKLTYLVHNSSDEADAFGVRLTTEQTLRIKQVDDAVDEILRLQRRQFRLARKAGFKILEWMVLGLMWWVWFVVVCWKTVRRIILGFVRMVRWLLYF